MKRAVFGFLSCALLASLVTACGGGSDNGGTDPPPQTPVSGLQGRVLVSNEFTNQLFIMESASDRFSEITITPGSRPRNMVVSPDKKFTVVYVDGSAALVHVDNTTEQATASINLGDWTESFIVTPDSKNVWAAVRNRSEVRLWNISAGTTEAVSVPLPRRLVRNTAGSRLLVFRDETDELTVIDTESKTPTAVTGFDRPVWGIFTDDTHALILSCGPQCGGSTARVTRLDLSTTPPTTGASVAVSAATIGLLDGTKLYVAGTAGTSGLLDVVDTGTLTVSKGGVPISDGFHHVMRMANNNRLFIGARTCSNVTNGCLSIFNTSAQTAVIGTPKGEVTGMQPISGTNKVYVAEGGELRIYDTSTDAEQATQRDFIGKIIDAAAIDNP